jgi:hypothetical protein
LIRRARNYAYGGFLMGENILQNEFGENADPLFNATAP